MDCATGHPLYARWRLESVRRFGDAGWRALPTLHRDDLRRQPPARNRGGALLYLSSGTTGRPKLVSYGPEDIQRVAALCARFAELEGVSRRSRVMVLLPMALWSAGRITVEGHRRLGAEVYPVDLHGGVSAWERLAHEIRPTVVSGTPSILAAWAPHYRGPPLELVETTGEPLLTRERHLIEAHFGGRVHDAYGLSEAVVGVECAGRHGFHYWPDATAVEVLHTDADRQTADGETGELVLTSFVQTHLPILRYRSGDLGRLVTSPCRCGHPTPRVEVAGRIGPNLALPRGVMLDASVVEDAFDELSATVQVHYKSTMGSLPFDFVRTSFVPVLELIYNSTSPPAEVRAAILAAIPQLAELVQENELNLDVFPQVATASRLSCTEK